ncbi:N-acylneuraminate cytidylyltransferase [Algoriphagus ornithinivorans]|uniref:N-acylneuraminate cytidylyltransferase n=1 Tax=Algoriphagus ornithinivorans TaxID=226506 RepID=A0A1I5HJP9_9BACT|nr:acylneuraminate cytidylyltransferase family protein [Algoriphagus ornithinivorans]SFO48487.1 N-acylneuraminate cytidylyltransferase [Algoriphagus ornithinivorans]
MKILGLIPARGGSKGIPGKNIKALGGKPLLAYTFDSAQESKLLSKVILSSDDSDIIAVANQIGLEVPFTRPENLANDQSPTLPVIAHALRFFEEKGEKFDAICLLQTTYPFRRKGLIDDAIKEFIRTDAEALVSVLPVPHEFNPHWVFEPGQNGFLEIATGEKQIIPRRQDLPTSFFRDGAIYITKSEVILSKNSILSEKLAYIVGDESRYVNLDTFDDWKKAEILVNKLFG